MSVEMVDGVSMVRFDHPPVNALDLDLLDDVIVTMRGLDGPVVITGAGRCFSAGVDLSAIVDGGAEYTDRFMTSLSAAFLAVFDHPAPVVAAINGHAIAGGCVFAMAADIRLMSAGTIGLTELAVGAMFPMSALEICRYAMGTSVTAQIWIRRLTQAATQLADPRYRERTVSEIAFEAGFEDAAHFTRAFKRRYQCTPREWRNRGGYLSTHGEGM